MAIQFKRGTSNNRTNYTPAIGELIVVDVTDSNPKLYVGDGSTAGGKLVSASGSGGGTTQNLFETISVAGQSNIVADTITDTLTLVAGSNITITTDDTNDSITINNTYSAPAETDPVFSAHVAAGINATKITSWDTAFSWGNHAGLYLSGSSSIDGLADVDTTTLAPTANQVLAWNGSKWAPATSTSGTTLSGLTDVVTTGASNGKILEYSNGNWIIGDKSGGSGGVTTLTGLSDTPTDYTNKANFFARVNSNATGIDFRDITASAPLSWNRSTSTLSFSADTDDISEGSTNLYFTNDRVNAVLGGKTYLEDSDFVSEGLMKRSATSGNYTIVTDSSANWNTAYGWGDHSVEGYITGISALSINALNDVTITSAQNNQILRWNGSAWINSDEVTVTTTLTGLTDTPSNYGTSGQMLESTGSGVQWVDAPTGGGGGGSSGLSDIKDDLTPQLGGDLDVLAREITTSTVNGDITLRPNGTGSVQFGTANTYTTGRSYFANVFTNFSDLPSASSYHGMFAHVHNTGNAYYGHAGAWKKLVDEEGTYDITGSLTVDNLKLDGQTITTDTDIIQTLGADIVSSGDAKQGMYLFKGTTLNDNANLTEIFVKGVTNSRLTVASGTVMGFDIMLVAQRWGMSSGNEKSASWNFKGCITNIGGTTSILGTIMKTVLGKTDSTYDCTVDAINANDALRIRVQGQSGQNIKWFAVVNTTEVAA